jgi:hypothetical protein
MPSKATLQKYGLTLDEWQAMYDKYSGACHVCRRIPGGRGILAVDHEHVRGWKNLPPEERKKYLRGLACFQCNNKLLWKGITKERLRIAAQYLEDYEHSKELTGQ